MSPALGPLLFQTQFHQSSQTPPGHHLTFLDQEALAAGLLAFASLFGTVKGNLLLQR